MAQRTHYDVLGIPVDATEDAITSRFRALVRTIHPDQFEDPHEKKEAQDKLYAVNEAYRILSKPEYRQRYDQTIRVTGTRERDTGARPDARGDSHTYGEGSPGARGFSYGSNYNATDANNQSSGSSGEDRYKVDRSMESQYQSGLKAAIDTQTQTIRASTEAYKQRIREATVVCEEGVRSANQQYTATLLTARSEYDQWVLSVRTEYKQGIVGLISTYQASIANLGDSSDTSNAERLHKAAYDTLQTSISQAEGVLRGRLRSLLVTQSAAIDYAKTFQEKETERLFRERELLINQAQNEHDTEVSEASKEFMRQVAEINLNREGHAPREGSEGRKPY